MCHIKLMYLLLFRFSFMYNIRIGCVYKCIYIYIHVCTYMRACTKLMATTAFRLGRTHLKMLLFFLCRLVRQKPTNIIINSLSILLLLLLPTLKPSLLPSPPSNMHTKHYMTYTIMYFQKNCNLRSVCLCRETL